MTKYELSLTKEYVPEWTLVDAVRELFQNALDQETVLSSNTMFWHHEGETLSIGNKLSVLEPRTLLLGSSTKVGDEDTIGKFGEGYKIATLVLTRLGKQVTFYNYGAREVWRARFSKSRKYGAEILVFEVDKKYPWVTVPDNNLTIEVEGVTEEEFLLIKESNLHMQKKVKRIETPHGRVLLDEKFKGKMYVNGLYISTAEDFVYGYDFNPDKVTLDRDRRLLRDFDLKWTTSKMWLSSEDEDVVKMAAELVERESHDTTYITDVTWESKELDKVSEEVSLWFLAKYGEKAVPVTTQEEHDKVPKPYVPTITTPNVSKLVKLSPNFVQPTYVNVPPLEERVSGWLDKHVDGIEESAVQELRDILNEESLKQYNK